VGTNVDRHLVDVHALLDAELGHVHVERRVEDADDLSGTDDGPVALREVANHDAEEQVRRLLLRELGRVALAVDARCIRA
jgi:hypothetical protein